MLLNLLVDVFVHLVGLLQLVGHSMHDIDESG